MTIRKAALKDLTAINEIYNFEVLNGTATFDTKERSYDDACLWFGLHNSCDHVIFVDEVDGVTTGYASLSSYRNKDAFKTTAEVSVYIHQNYRHSGIGRKLLNYLITYAINETELHNLIAVITHNNFKSINLFTSLGFNDGGVIPECGQKFGSYLGISNLYKIIR